MKHQIETNFKRIGLHDSHFSEIKIEKGKIFIKIDWGFLENFKEENVFDAIVFDKADLCLFNIGMQTFKKLTDNGTVPTLKPDDFETANWLVLTNEYSFADNYHIFKFNISNDFRLYLEWTVSFEKGRLEWDKFILHKNWLTGKETLDNNE